jgi:hypothetical protein
MSRLLFLPPHSTVSTHKNQHFDGVGLRQELDEKRLFDNEIFRDGSIWGHAGEEELGIVVENQPVV